MRNQFHILANILFYLNKSEPRVLPIPNGIEKAKNEKKKIIKKSRKIYIRQDRKRQFTSFTAHNVYPMMFMMGVPHYAHTQTHIKCHC